MAASGVMTKAVVGVRRNLERNDASVQPCVDVKGTHGPPTSKICDVVTTKTASAPVAAKVTVVDDHKPCEEVQSRVDAAQAVPDTPAVQPPSAQTTTTRTRDDLEPSAAVEQTVAQPVEQTVVAQPVEQTVVVQRVSCLSSSSDRTIEETQASPLPSVETPRGVEESADGKQEQETDSSAVTSPAEPSDESPYDASLARSDSAFVSSAVTPSESPIAPADTQQTTASPEDVPARKQTAVSPVPACEQKVVSRPANNQNESLEVCPANPSLSDSQVGSSTDAQPMSASLDHVKRPVVETPMTTLAAHDEAKIAAAEAQAARDAREKAKRFVEAQIAERKAAIIAHAAARERVLSDYNKAVAVASSSPSTAGVSAASTTAAATARPVAPVVPFHYYEIPAFFPRGADAQVHAVRRHRRRLYV